MNIKSNWFFRNLANIITFVRLFVLSPILSVVIITHHRDWIITIILLFTVAFLTDFFDGKVARWLKIVSTFGGAMDRLGDKVIFANWVLFLILDGRIHLSLKIIIVPLAVIEASLLAVWFMGRRKKMNVSAGKWGKKKMFLVSVAIFLCLLNIIIEERWGPKYHLLATILLNLMVAVSIIFAVKSFLGHRAKYHARLFIK